MSLLIVTPTLGRSCFLEETVNCIYRLDAPIQHIISCPQDQIAVLQKRFPLSRVVADQGKEGGIYGAINAGLSAARERWDFFTYLNDDDLLGHGFGTMFERHAMASNRDTVAYGWISNIDKSGRILMGMTVGPDPRHYPALLQMGISPTGQQGMIFGREVVGALGFYSTRYKLCGDLDYWCRAMAAGFRFVFYPVEAGKFRMHEGQLSSDIETTRRELVQITNVHFPREASAVEKLHAKVIYRLYNAPRYIQRITNWGFVSSYQLLESKGYARSSLV